MGQFDRILDSTSHTSPRATYGKARALDRLSELKRSNEVLEKSIESFAGVLRLGDSVPDELYLLAGNRLVERMQFRGWSNKATAILELMLKRFPQNIGLLNNLGTQHLLQGQNKLAQFAFETVLDKMPLDGYASRHLGFILKTSGNSADLEQGVALLSQGVLGDDPSPEGKFYYHLGEGLRRLGREPEANVIYEKGVEKGLFRSFWQRSLYNCDVRGQPVWRKDEIGLEGAQGLELLERNWQVIRDEAMALLLDGERGFSPETENLQDTGVWKQLELYQRGQRVEAGCSRAPRTCSLLQMIPAATTNKRGQVKFSVMYPGTHVHAHSGPTNCRLRAHLGLRVPPPPPREGGLLRMRVADKYLEWEEGKAIVFDDSFDHEVWHFRDGARVVLIVDLWHPDLDERTKSSLVPI